MKVIHLPPANGLTGKSENIYAEYAILRKHSSDFQIWFKRTYAKQNAKCFYCRISLKGRRTNVEHIIPKSRGGTNNPSNLVISCAPCNKQKGSKLLDKTYIDKQRKKVKKDWRRSAIEYKRNIENDEAVYELLSWIV